MKSKGIIITMGIIIVALIAVVLFLLVRDNNGDDNNNNVVTDAERFAEEYTLVPDDNVFVYSSVDEIIDILENGAGVVYLGFPECQWCGQYVVYLNEVAKERGISEIHYYNIREDRSNNTDNYLKIVSLLEDYLEDDEEGNPRIYVPAIIFMNNGEIVGFDDETSLDTGGASTPSEYWTDEKVNALKDRLNSYIDKANVCIDCNS